MDTLIAEKADVGLRVRAEDGIAILELDLPGSKVNKLTTAVVTELAHLLESLGGDPRARGVVLVSRKHDVFIAGADLDEIEALETEGQAAAASRTGQRIFQRIESLGKPVIAAVHGACLGGGCEMILACHWRILSDDPSTRLGLPEVKLGILPGFGGTQRLPRIVGLQASLDLILTGKTVDARRALKLGVADELVYPPLLVEAATASARRLAESGRFGFARRSRRPRASVPGFLDRTALGRAVVFRAAEKRVRRETHGHYPAPLAAIDVVRAGIRRGGRAYEYEAAELGRLAMTDVSRNLIGIFRLTEANKRLGADLPDPGGRVRLLGVVGAGVMGGGIAYQAASNDIRVRLKDIAPEPLLAAFRTARDLFRSRVRRGRMQMRELENRMAHISATLDDSGFGQADVVIEAVVENLDVKRKVLAQLEAVVGEECVLASNTSSLSIAGMADGLHRPERVVGMHFFNPVHRMPLVEIIRAPGTDPRAVARVLGLARQMGKTPVIVADAPGFLVNRILAPFMNESAWLFEEGEDVVAVDRVLKRFGMPMGAFELIDEVGTDVADKVGQVLHAGLGERMQPAPLAGKLHTAGRLGRKTGRGVYIYSGKGPHARKSDPDVARTLRSSAPHPGTARDDEIRDRVFGRMIDEAARCLDEGIVGSAGELDLALIYGIGFPPFRGGLLKYADTRGLAVLVDRLRDFEARLGPRFAPSERLVRMASSGERFFPESRNAARV
jgi:3-hydroxyacyl-CoA dehydrogenase/enoyl-CoA hydratase/3-hydroxybutyryl-CoA epimerase